MAGQQRADRAAQAQRHGRDRDARGPPRAAGWWRGACWRRASLRGHVAEGHRHVAGQARSSGSRRRTATTKAITRQRRARRRGSAGQHRRRERRASCATSTGRKPKRFSSGVVAGLIAMLPTNRNSTSAPDLTGLQPNTVWKSSGSRNGTEPTTIQKTALPPIEAPNVGIRSVRRLSSGAGAAQQVAHGRGERERRDGAERRRLRPRRRRHRDEVGGVGEPGEAGRRSAARRGGRAAAAAGACSERISRQRGDERDQRRAAR